MFDHNWKKSGGGTRKQKEKRKREREREKGLPHRLRDSRARFETQERDRWHPVRTQWQVEKRLPVIQITTKKSYYIILVHKWAKQFILLFW